MAEAKGKPDLKNLLRFSTFAVRHWRLIVLALVAMSVYAAVNGGLILVVKPIIDSFRTQQYAAEMDAGDWAAEADLEPGNAVPADDPLDSAKHRVVGWLRQFRLVKKAEQLLSPRDDPRAIAWLIALVIGPVLVVSGFVQAYAQRRVVWSIMAEVRMAVFAKISRLSLRFFARQRTGELVSRLTNDVNNTQTAVRVLFGKILLEPMRLLILLGIALWSSWQLTLLAHVTFPPLLFVMGRYGYRIRRYGNRNLQRLADVTDSITQMLSGIRVVKAFNMEEAENEEFRKRNEEQLRQAFKLVRNRALAESLPEYLILLPVALIILVSADLVSSGTLTVGGMFQCMIALGVMGGSTRRIVKAYADLQSSAPGVTRIFELLDTVPDIEDDADAVDLTGVREGIRFQDVWFGYDDEPVLRGINVFVPAGKVYAIVGETGAGKSTMLDLIPRFYDVTRGSVSIDGVDVRNVCRNSLMRQIGIVGQHPFLFNRSIAENIRYGKPDATDEEVMNAARAANIHEFIQSLPEGYDTNAGEAGGRLSGGQRQCVTIARALLKNAPILILDEATSSLDAQSEMLVQQGLNNLMAGRTTLVIAHRLSTVRHADSIVVLRDGQVAEQGTHEELLAAGGEYERLYRMQFAEET